MTGQAGQPMAIEAQPAGRAALDFLSLEITQTCNLHCGHCYADASPFVRNREVVDWSAAIAQAGALGCRKVQFIGGEPTIHPRLTALAREAHEAGFGFIEVYSNLVRVPSVMLDDFVRLGVHVATSFYSRHAATHDAVTRSPGSFVRTVKGIRAVLERGIDLRVGMTLTERNAAHVEETVAFLLDLGVKREAIAMDTARPIGRGMAGAGVVDVASAMDSLCGQCWRGRLTVSWDGKCYPCVLARCHVVGDLARQTLAEVVAGRNLESFRRRVFANYMSRLDWGGLGEQLLRWFPEG
ncbi:MAG TPA: radical SAM protein [Novosphingobium sp.]|nr:radical SAM protein [Novosphingobium sp.]